MPTDVAGRALSSHQCAIISASATGTTILVAGFGQKW
jgi:hypothetical protein